MELPCGEVFTGEGGVDEDEIPLMKTLYNFMSRRLNPELIKQAEKDMLPTHIEPSSSSFNKYITDL
jgi:hypothetical protein